MIPTNYNDLSPFEKFQQKQYGNILKPREFGGQEMEPDERPTMDDDFNPENFEA